MLTHAHKAVPLRNRHEAMDFLRFFLPLAAKGYSRSLAMLRNLEELSGVSPDDLRIVLNRKRTALLEFLFESVPWYSSRRNHFPPVSTMACEPEAWCELPLQSKEMIRENEKDFISENLRTPVWNETSGSTGQKFRFPKDENQNYWAEATTAFVRKQITGRYVPSETVVWGAPRDVSPDGKLLTLLRNRFRRYHKIIAYRADNEFLHGVLCSLSKNSSQLLSGYPNILAILADLDENGILARHMCVLSAGEWLRPSLRSTIENRIGKRMFDFYGCREAGSIAYECREHEGLHILSPVVHLEVVRDNGSPCEPGEVGEIVITSLVRRSMPLVRYRLGDMGELGEGPCGCGCVFPLLRSLCGRTMDVITLPDGEALVANFWTFLSREVPGVRQFRVLQDETGLITMEIVPGAGAEACIKEMVHSEVSKRLKVEMNLIVNLVERLPVNQSGKTGLVVSHYEKAKKL